MKAFEVYLNGVKLCTAGVYEHGVLSTVVNWVGSFNGTPHPKAGFHCIIGGLDSSTGQSMQWAAPSIDVGDEITIRIVETDEVDPAAPTDRVTGVGWSPD
jgi:hypothetical protein